MTQATLNVATLYQYDGEGRRIGKLVCPTLSVCDWTTQGASTTLYVYDAQGNVVAEYAQSATPPPTPLCTTCYLGADHLGSTRVVTNALGAVAYHDYLPFGEEIPSSMGGRSSLYGGADGVTRKFTGKERDAELASSAMQGLDFFGARYYSGAQGRYTTPDWSEKPEPIPYANLSDPQTFNLYTYGRNNPLSNKDEDGHCTVDGENHGWLWCLGHAVGATQTVKEQAAVVEEQRTWLVQNHGRNDHPNPHQHPYDPKTGKRGRKEPLQP
jgi:RHS repeat-associated protein